MSDSPKLIGLIGLKGCGKSTVAQYIANKYSYIEYAFANPLKAVCRELFLLNEDQLYGDNKESKCPEWFNCTPRQMLQFIGTDLLRDNLNTIMPGIGKNIFIHHFKIWYNKFSTNNLKGKVVVSDVRFLNELDCIKYLGGICIKICRPKIVLSEDTHASETEQIHITDYDYLIHNDGSLENLYAKIDEIFSKFK